MSERGDIVESLTAERFNHRSTWCGKKVFLSESVARNFAWLVETAENDGVRRRAYECNRCGYWHITRQPPKGARDPTTDPGQNDHDDERE